MRIPSTAKCSLHPCISLRRTRASLPKQYINDLTYSNELQLLTFIDLHRLRVPYRVKQACFDSISTPCRCALVPYAPRKAATVMEAEIEAKRVWNFLTYQSHTYLRSCRGYSLASMFPRPCALAVTVSTELGVGLRSVARSGNAHAQKHVVLPIILMLKLLPQFVIHRFIGYLIICHKLDCPHGIRNRWASDLGRVYVCVPMAGIQAI